MKQAAPASKAATRASTYCSMFEIVFAIDATDCVRDRILFSNLLKPCTSMGIEANAAKWTSNWASLLVSMDSNFSAIVLVRRPPTPSRSGREPLGEPKFEEEAGGGDIGTFVPSLTRAMRKAGKLQNWVVDTWTRQNQKAREREKHRARSSRKWLEPKWLAAITDCDGFPRTCSWYTSSLDFGISVGLDDGLPRACSSALSRSIDAGKGVQPVLACGK